MHLWKEGLAYPPHTSIVHPCRPRCIQRSRNRCCSRCRCFLELNLPPASTWLRSNPGPTTDTSAGSRPIRPRRQPKTLVTLLSGLLGYRTGTCWTFTPLILTTARRQFVPRNRRDEPANHTRARHSDKVSTAGRRDFLVPAQPKPAGAAYQRVHRTLPPRAKPEYIGNPSPSESDPAAQSTLPCLHYLLPLLYMLCSASLPFTFILRLLGPVFSRSLHSRRRRQPATGNRPIRTQY